MLVSHSPSPSNSSRRSSAAALLRPRLMRHSSADSTSSAPKLSSEVAVEGFDEWILPGCAGFDVAGCCVVEAAPVAECLADEFGAVVAADQLGWFASPLGTKAARTGRVRAVSAAITTR